MKLHYITLCFLLISVMVISGCPSPQHHTIKHHQVQQPQPTDPSQPPAPLPDTSKPNWADEKIQATGEAAVNPKFAHNPAQAKLMAKRGAKIEARRNLIERVMGLRLNSKTVVKDMVTEKDDLDASTSGFIRQSYIIGEHFANGIYTVNVELKLYNVYTYMKKKKIYYK